MLAGADWDVALLQECPPRWAERLATACGAEPHLVADLPQPARPRRGCRPLAADFNPDLIASWEGGSNLTLVRATGVGAPGDRRAADAAPRRAARAADDGVHPRSTRGLCIANLHASKARDGRRAGAARRGPARASPGRRRAARARRRLQHPPGAQRPRLRRARARHGLAAPTGPKVIDHLLVRGPRSSSPRRSGRRRRARSPTRPRRRARPADPPLRPRAGRGARSHPSAQSARPTPAPGRTPGHRVLDEEPTGRTKPAAKKAAAEGRREEEARRRRSRHAEAAAKKRRREALRREAKAKSRPRRAQAPRVLRRPRRQERRGVPRRARAQRHPLARADPGGRRRRRQARPHDPRRRQRDGLQAWSPAAASRPRTCSRSSRSCSTRPAGGRGPHEGARKTVEKRTTKARKQAEQRADASPRPRARPPTSRSPRPTSCAAAPGSARASRSPATTISPRRRSGPASAT